MVEENAAMEGGGQEKDPLARFFSRLAALLHESHLEFSIVHSSHWTKVRLLQWIKSVRLGQS